MKNLTWGPCQGGPNILDSNFKQTRDSGFKFQKDSVSVFIQKSQPSSYQNHSSCLLLKLWYAHSLINLRPRIHESTCYLLMNPWFSISMNPELWKCRNMDSWKYRTVLPWILGRKFMEVWIYHDFNNKKKHISMYIVPRPKRQLGLDTPHKGPSCMGVCFSCVLAS